MGDMQGSRSTAPNHMLVLEKPTFEASLHVLLLQ